MISILMHPSWVGKTVVRKRRPRFFYDIATVASFPKYSNMFSTTPYHLTEEHNVIPYFFVFFSDTTACYADQDDDIIFEDFARLRLKGETDG